VKSETLIVVAAVNDDYKENLPTYTGGDLLVQDTSAGGHPTGAYIKAFHEWPEYESYLFIQDSMRGIVDDVTAAFREHGSDVVAWGLFEMGWDGPDQMRWVLRQYPARVKPTHGIFGPVFYATRGAMEKAERWFPDIPSNRLEAQGTERAWAYTFAAANIEVGSLGDWSNELMAHGPYPVFRKVFALRP
jgi:hypothetical protein